MEKEPQASSPIKAMPIRHIPPQSHLLSEQEMGDFVKVVDFHKTADLVKMVSKPRDWPAFEILLEEVEKCKRKFQAFSLTHIPRTKNTKADKLARSARDQPYDVYYINSVPPVSLPEPA
ncbi:unnamed protein product [Microthlaspi erraticum]|uniref:RNase H type-1 domain-containing protein n=1 Tax=Microthlaspi erraticum TaxID=1685480 RepID=A0A6D2K7P8_9BRAS|nr:unnamed protein product [Microthlaspi erraticum]